MSIKGLFGKKSNKVVSSKQVSDINNQVESEGYTPAHIDEKNRFFPNIDFSDPTNWARYGSAEKYYNDAIVSIYQTYPYDGSWTEKQQWINSSSYIDEYIFENEYPRTTGYLDLRYGKLSTTFTDTTNGDVYRLYDDPQYIKVKGGPNTGPADDRIGANIYDESKNRGSNLSLKPSDGNTVEFWLSASVLSEALPGGTVITGSGLAHCLFDLWNQTGFGTASYGRFMVETLETAGDHLFTVTYMSGTTGADRVDIGNINNILVDTPSYDSGSWNHYAISAASSGSSTVLKFYLNGTLTDTKTSSGAPSEVTGALNANIGAYQYAPITLLTGSITEGWAPMWGGLDEFRFWKAERTPTQIGRNWFTQVAAGSNKDDIGVNLGVYFKFNEGILNTGSIDAQDATTLDYSGRLSNGTIQNYSTSPATRYTGSAMDISPLVDSEMQEFRDPIVYSDHPDVTSILSTKKTSGAVYDTTNNSNLFFSMPEWITSDEEEIESGTLKNLVQIVSSYLDKLHLQVEALTKIKDVEYFNSAEYQEPQKFAKRLLDATGLQTSDIFVNAEILEEILSRGEERVFEKDLFRVKNLIYQNLYSNIVHIYKAKGTEKSFRNAIRCFGVDSELVSINLYANNVDYRLQDDRQYGAIGKNYINFDQADRWAGTVYQQTASGNVNSLAYIPAVSGTQHDYVPYTLETEVIFPKQFTEDNPFYEQRDFITASLFGSHEVNTSSLDWSTNDYGNFQVYAIREQGKKLTTNAYFKLVSTGFGPTIELTSDAFKEVYENQKWNFAVRLRPSSDDLLDLVDGSTTQSTAHTLEFYGVNATLDTVDNEFLLTASINNASASLALNANKRIYMGAHRQDFTGSSLQKTDAKISSIRYWVSYLDNDTIQNHAFDAGNAGATRPFRPAYFQQSSLDGRIIPEIKTLALHWDFENVTGSDAGVSPLPLESDGQFVVDDVTSGSATLDEGYGWVNDVVKYQFTGRGDFWLKNNSSMVDKEYVNTAMLNLPENLNASNTVNILTQDDDTFPKQSRPIEYFYAIEKSMYQAISREMVSMFASIADFQNLIGEPVNRYRMEYKDLSKLRQIFFQNVENTPSLEKYVEFYKWLDNGLNVVLQQLVPISANFDQEMRTMVESHVLERNKYWSKFPTLEMKAKDPEGSIRAINELTYDWKNGHAPETSTDQDDECLWYAERAERNGSDITSGNSAVDTDRQAILDIKTNETNATVGDLYDQSTGQTYDGNTYAIRRLSKPYKFGVQLKETIHGGTNTPSRKRSIDFVRSVVKPETSSGLRVFTNIDEGISPLCDDDEAARFPLGKKIIDGTAQVLGQPRGYLNRLKASIVSPDSEYYDTNTNQRYNANTHTHNDSYGDDGETPMQGPFTRTHVGGSQHRHIDPNKGSDSALNRAELYRVDVQADYRDYLPPETDNPKAAYYRDELAKRPVNIRNIQWGTGSYWVGNFRRNYEVVQTVGRSTNNRYFTRNGGTDIVPIASTFVTGLDDFTLPDRGRTESIIVNRFAAPGDPTVSSRGSLDIEAEELSAYNDLNYRNFLVRSELNKWLTFHSEWNVSGAAAMSSDPNVSFGTPSYHKVQRNTKRRFALSGTSETETICKENYDNFWVQHQIPQSDYQYRWIAAGALTSSCPMGYVSDYPNLSTSITFALTTASYTPYYPPVVTGSNLHDRLVYRDGTYQYASWQQVRTGEMIEARYNKKNNVISVEKRNNPVINAQGNFTTPLRSETTSSFFDPPVSFNKPTKVKVKFPNDVGGFQQQASQINFPVVNSLETYGNRELASDQNELRWSDLTAYDYIYGVYENLFNEGIKFVSLNHKETVYPSHQNTGLKKIRTKENYEEIAGTGDNGYDRNSGIIRSFWRDSPSDRRRTQYVSSNSFGQVETTDIAFGDSRFDSMWALDLVSSSAEQIRGDLAYVGADRYKNVWITASFDITGLMDVEAANEDVRNAIQLIYNPYTASTDYAEGGWQWKAQEISGRKPFYNSYEDYVLDVRTIGQNYSVVPEYKMSDHIEFYIKDNGGNFRADNPNFLKVDGGSITGSQSTTDPAQYNSEFFKVYSHSDFMTNFGKISEDHKQMTNPTTTQQFSIKVNAVKKLLPYNGFYPSQRTVQLSRLFMDSYGVHFTGSQEPGSSGSVRHTKQAALQPFFAPGILYNTIKSGIAVDWATFQGQDSCLEIQGKPASYFDLYRVTGSDTTDYDYFGWQVAAEEEYVIVGAPLSGAAESPSLAGTGSVYIYSKGGDGSWDQEFKIPNPYPSGTNVVGDYYGASVGITKNTSGSFVIVGSPNDDNRDTTPVIQDSGLASIYQRSVNFSNNVVSWGLVDAFSGSTAQDAYGGNVAVLGEYAAFNSEEDPGTYPFAGAKGVVYIKKYNGTNWVTDATISGSHAAFDVGAFGSPQRFLTIPVYPFTHKMIDFSGNKIAVGDGTAQDGSDTIGSVTIFNSGSASGWTVEGVVTGSDLKAAYASTAAVPFYGSPVSIDGNLLAVGAPLKRDLNDISQYNGAVYIYEYDGTNWNEVQILEAFDQDFEYNKQSYGVSFGSSVSLDSNTLVVGSWLSARDGISSGLVSIYKRKFTKGKTLLDKGGQTTFELVETISSIDSPSIDGSSNPGSRFGISADLNKNSLAIGAYFEVKSDISGAAYIKSYCTPDVYFRSDARDNDGDGIIERGFTPFFYNQNVADASAGRVITGQPSLRLPFESILTLKNNVPEDRNVWMMAPEYYTGSAATGSDYVYPYFKWDGQSSNPLYNMASSNFLAEIPKFFLRKQGLTTFTSQPQKNFKSVVAGQTYYMDVTLSKNDLDMVLSPHSGSSTTQGRYFGPSALYNDSTASYGNASKNSLDPAFAPWTPPYFYGETTARIKFTAPSSNIPTLSEILANSTVEYTSDQIETVFRDAGDVGVDGVSPGSVAYSARMNVTASVELFGTTQVKKVSYNVNNEIFGETAARSGQDIFVPISAEDTQGSEGDAWVIYSKFECPVLNFNNDANKSKIDSSNTSFNNPEARGIGMWSGYGELPDQDSSITLKISETPEDVSGGKDFSLAKICGFQTVESKIGEVADSKKISEAIVMIPFIDKPISFGKNGPETTNVAGFNFFRISNGENNRPELFRTQELNIKAGKPAITQGQFGAVEDVENTSISRMIRSMRKYNIPPQFDFLTYPKDINPFVMYFAEFEHELSKLDLANIWQGVLPDIGLRAERDSVEVNHLLDNVNFFEGKQIPETTRWMVFKVKRRAEDNYYKTTADSTDDDRFKFDFFAGEGPEYSYNYPYDYFSLVETVSVEAGLDITGNEPKLLATFANPGQGQATIPGTDAAGQQVQEAKEGTSDAERASQKTPVASQAKKLPGIFGIKGDS